MELWTESLTELDAIDFATLDLLPYGIIVVDREGKILYYNAREEQIAGRRKENVIGRNFFTEVAPCTQVRDFYGRFQEAMNRPGWTVNFQFRFPFPDNPREVEIALTSFENRGDRLCLISVNDVTEQKALRERLIRAEHLRELGEVAAGVAHNFGNLLMVIRGNAEVMLDMTEDEALRRRIEKIIKASDDGAKLVQRIRDSARHKPEDVERAEIDLNDVLRDSVAWMEDYIYEARRERGAAIDTELDLTPDLPRVRASATEMREVFVNLLRNAVDAIRGEGRIRVRSAAEDGRVVVEVSDTGCGMSADVMAKIFHPLFTTKGERGTGLGLTTCYAIVRRHGGDIRVRSEEGKGTTFTVSLPRSVGEAA